MLEAQMDELVQKLKGYGPALCACKPLECPLHGGIGLSDGSSWRITSYSVACLIDEKRAEVTLEQLPDREGGYPCPAVRKIELELGF